MYTSVWWLQVKLALLVILVHSPLGYSSLDYITCGGDELSSIQIEGCEASPCTLKAGSTYHVIITPVLMDPLVTSTPVDILLYQYGAQFNQTSYVVNECGSNNGCPLTDRLLEPEIHIYFNVEYMMVVLPAILRVQSTYYNDQTSVGGFCADLNVSIYK